MTTMTRQTAVIRCANGDHTIELHDRELVAERLLKASAKRSYNPDTDVDWDAPLDPDAFYMPAHTISLYETPQWDAMTHRQRVELSRHELVSMISFGIWSEILLMKGLLSHAYRRDYTSSNVAYAFTEVADECRHSAMFGKLIGRLGLKPYPMAAPEFHLGKLFGIIEPPLVVFAAVLLIEEVTDAIQRASLSDDEVQPMVRAVNQIHVVEEARHIKFAREELKHLLAGSPRPLRRLQASVLATAAVRMAPRLVRPEVYRAVGLDPKVAYRTAKASPHRQATLQWAFRRATGFFTEIGLIEGPSEWIWRRTGTLAVASR